MASSSAKKNSRKWSLFEVCKDVNTQHKENDRQRKRKTLAHYVYKKNLQKNVYKELLSKKKKKNVYKEFNVNQTNS